MGGLDAQGGEPAVVRLLLAEDDAATRAVFRWAAEHSGLPVQVEAVANGAEVMQYLEGAGWFKNREQYPLPDLLVLDLAMPVMNGFEVLRALRSSPQSHALPVVALSGVTYPGWSQSALALGAVEFLEKGQSLEDWIKVVKKAVDCVMLHRSAQAKLEAGTPGSLAA